MLDAETKRRIDTARDILVGKVPDPKSQVEQITIALIYKFMDDMDLGSEELGGERSFFKGEFEKYAWRRIFNPRMGGFEILALYSEAIMKMNVNPNIPQLFRDIFKNAYLPYRDPETLKAFLKIINEFTYDHSERLGDAFEYLLSVLGSQGEAGQFRTPRHIIDFMVAIIDPKKDEVILDPACGTAGFLISSYKHIIKNNSSNYDPAKDIRMFETKDMSLSDIVINSKNYKGDKLTPDERNRLANSIKGYDISPDMVRLSLVNMYLHGLHAPHINEYDTLTSEDNWNEYADVILANPPFMSPKGGIRPHKRFSISSNRSEVLFVDYIAEHLTPNGRAAVIVPEGIIFQSGNSYKKLRKMLVENYLVGVISLPAGVFNPYSGVKTSILWLDRVLAKQTDKILFIKIENDGFDLGAQRRPIKFNDLPEAFSLIIDLKKKLLQDYLSEISEAFTVDKKTISKLGDYNLSLERYRKEEVFSSSYPLVKLEDLFEIQRGGSPRPIQEYITDSPDGINWIKISDAKEGSKFITGTKEKIRKEGLKKSRLVEPGDFILSNSMSFGRPYIMKITGCIHDGWLVLKQRNDKVSNDYIYSILLSDNVKLQFKKSATGGVVNNLNINLVKQVKIPLPPLFIQEEIVAEIEGYQKIIDGARQVVENYKPRIEIDPEWPMVELREACTIKSGGTPSRNNPEYWNGKIPWVGSTVCKDIEVTFAEEYITELGLEKSAAKIFQAGTTLIALVGATIGKTGYLTFPCSTNQNIAGLLPKENETLDNKFLFYIAQSLYPKFLELGEGKFRMANLSFIKLLKIPIPDISTQKLITRRIENERNGVLGNEYLIRSFEQKIKDRIAKVWGS